MITRRLEIAELAASLPTEIDLLIVSASFESRCRSVSDSIDPLRVPHALIAQNQNHAEFHDDQATYLMGRFEGRSHLMRLDTAHPLVTADSMVKALHGASKNVLRHVVIDISTFTREAFLILYRLIDTLWDDRTTKYFVYARAQEYSTDCKLEDKWLSRGIADVRSILGYPGRFEPSRRLHLIVLVGFEYDRVAELIRRCEPSVISLGQAMTSEPDGQSHLEMHRYNYERLRSVFGEVSRFEFPGYDSDGARDAILSEHRTCKDYNCMLAPMNTKISALGAAQAAILEPSIQIIYAQAIIYNVQAYSRAGDVCYLLTANR